jgi:tetratricopeptide (TPR) repeat protein
MPPEQAGGKSKEAGPLADVYALGAVLYELLTGRPPFLGATLMELLLQVQTEEPVPPTRLQPRCPRDLETICLKCLEKEPRRRYGSARELADDLRRFLHHEPLVARPAGVLGRLGKFAQRNKVLVGGVAAVFLALVLGLLGTGLGLVQANAARNRAQGAEREARELLAQSYQQTAALAMRRGAWRSALENIDRALETAREVGLADSVALHIDRVKAWAALDERPKAVEELQQLAQRTDLGNLEGAVLLWQGDMALCRIPSDDDAALAIVKRAVAKGLPRAEAAYAAGLLAETSAEAVEHFQRALQEDPFHQRANGMLIQLLTYGGRLADARDRVAFAEQVFPDDPTFQVLHAQIKALEDDLPAARALVDQAPQLKEQQRATARALIELLGDFRHMDVVVGEDPAAELLPPLQKVLRATLRMRGEMGDKELAASGLLIPSPPVLSKAFRRVPALLLPLTLRDYDRVSKELADMTRIHPDGLLYLTQGLFLAVAGRLAEAEEVFLTAADKPSLVPLRRPALMHAIQCEWLLHVGVGSNPTVEPKNRLFQARGQLGAVFAALPGVPLEALPAAYLLPEAPLQRALRNVRRYVDLGGVRPTEAHYLLPVALATGEVDLGRWILSQWEHQAPNDLEMLRGRVQVELTAGAYGPALAAAEKVLQQKPGDSRALRWQQQAAVQLRK